MSKLVVLSEIDCLNTLNKYGVKPAEYYTDFEKFKKRAPYFTDVIVVCLLAGTCTFSKRHIVDYCDLLSKRSEDASDGEIKDVYLLSDTVLPRCDLYYMYSEFPDKFMLYKNWKCTKKDVDFWGKLEYDKLEDDTNCFYSMYDKSDVTDVKKDMDLQFKELDDLIGLIKIPKIQALTK